VLLLVAWEELTSAEAAAVLGVPQGTARSRLHMAGLMSRTSGQRQASANDEAGRSP
jgi:DNA-directed RNA polymerase specialized sigma24 family protein